MLRGIRRTMGAAQGGEGARHRGHAEADAGALPRHADRRPRPRAAGPRLRRCVPPLRTRRPRGCRSGRESPDGLRVTIRPSKTWKGRGPRCAILRGCRLRPVEAVQTRLATAEICTGPVFCVVGRGGQVSCGAMADGSAARIVRCAPAGARIGRSGLLRWPQPAQRPRVYHATPSGN